MREFTKKELALYDGQRGLPILIAYPGQVYDVSASYHWKGGRHQVLHPAGIDLTEGFREAPHGADVFRKFPLVGRLIED
jgi:predicted heme/steroid binding protein